MGKRKSADIAAWDGVAHVRIRLDVLDSPAWRVLPHSVKAFYIDLRAKLRSCNNGNINAVLGEMKHRGWGSSATVAKALRILERMGLIAKTRQGGIASMSRVCTLFRFTDLPTPEWPKLGIPSYPATCDYKRFESVKEARAALREASPGKKSKLQKMKLLASDFEAMRRPIASDSEVVAGSKLQNLKQSKPAETRATSGVESK